MVFLILSIWPSVAAWGRVVNAARAFGALVTRPGSVGNDGSPSGGEARRNVAAQRLRNRPQAAARFTEATKEGTSSMSDMVPSPFIVAPEMPDTEPM